MTKFEEYVIIVDGTTRCDGCGKYPGTEAHEAEMRQFVVGLTVCKGCHKCSTQLRLLIQTGRIT